MQKLLSKLWKLVTVKRFSMWDLWIIGALILSLVTLHFWLAIIMFIIGVIVEATIQNSN